METSNIREMKLKPFHYVIIVGRYLTGYKKADIQCAKDLAYSTINTNIETYKTSTTGISYLYSGQVRYLF